MSMIDEIRTMTDDQMDYAIATEVMGWHMEQGWYVLPNYKVPPFMKMGRWVWLKEKYRPSVNLNQCYKAEERIVELGLVSNYLISPQSVVVFSEWAMVHATARQRCEAMLMAVRGAK